MHQVAAGAGFSLFLASPDNKERLDKLPVFESTAPEEAAGGGRSRWGGGGGAGGEIAERQASRLNQCCFTIIVGYGHKMYPVLRRTPLAAAARS